MLLKRDRSERCVKAPGLEVRSPWPCNVACPLSRTEGDPPLRSLSTPAVPATPLRRGLIPGIGQHTGASRLPALAARRLGTCCCRLSQTAMPAQGSEDVWGHPAVRRVLDMREFLKAGSWRPFHETALQAPGLTAILAALHFAALRVAALAVLAELEGCGEAAVRLIGADHGGAEHGGAGRGAPAVPCTQAGDTARPSGHHNHTSQGACLQLTSPLKQVQIFRFPTRELNKHGDKEQWHA